MSRELHIKIILPFSDAGMSEEEKELYIEFHNLIQRMFVKGKAGKSLRNFFIIMYENFHVISENPYAWLTTMSTTLSTICELEQLMDENLREVNGRLEKPMLSDEYNLPIKKLKELLSNYLTSREESLEIIHREESSCEYQLKPFSNI